MSEKTISLAEFADREGTTDDPRADVPIGGPNDGHHHYADIDEGYWLDEPQPGLPPLGGRVIEGVYNPTPVPAGPVTIVLDPALVERAGSGTGATDRGMYLKSSPDRGTTPPPPVATDDALLVEAAQAHLDAAGAILDGSDHVAAVSSGTHFGSLNITVDDPKLSQTYLWESPDSGPMPTINAIDLPDPELFHGFWKIRKFGHPFELVTEAEAPRLELEPLDIPDVLR